MHLTVLHLTPAEVSEIAAMFTVAADEIRSVRVGFDGDGFKVSVAQRSWTPGYGSTSDPLWDNHRTEGKR